MNLKETQKSLLAMLVEFDRVCHSSGINYSLHGGTLLGGVRERGFIAWDDDADVTMTRADFQSLANALNASDAGFCIAGSIKKQFRMRNRSDVWVDIFICDHISENQLAQRAKKHVLTVLDIMNRDADSMRLSNLASYGTFKRMAFALIYWLGRLVPDALKASLYAYVSRNLWLGGRTLYFRSNDQYRGREKAFPVAWFDSYSTVDFEDIYLSVSSNFHDILVSCYGADYMTPRRDDRNADVHELVRSAANGGMRL